MKLSEEKIKKISPEDRLGTDEIKRLAGEVPLWALAQDSLEREFTFRNFEEAISFVNRAANMAAANDHHPDILVRYNKVKLVFTTHKAGGLTRNDFIMAAKTDGILQPA